LAKMATRVPAATVQPHVAGMLFRAALAAVPPLEGRSTEAGVAAGEGPLSGPLWEAGRAESLRQTHTQSSALHHEVRALCVCDH